MPKLGSGLTLSKGKVRSPKEYYFERFKSTSTGGFTSLGTNATVSNGGEGLVVSATATNGYASKNITVDASTKYAVQVNRVLPGAFNPAYYSTGNVSVFIGKTKGMADLMGVINLDVPATNVNDPSHLMHFTTDGSTTSIWVHFMVATSGKKALIRDCLIESYESE